MKVIRESEFYNEVNDGLVLVDFYAEWCGPCKMFAPILEQVERENDDIKVVKINIDNDKRLAAYFKVQSIPTLLVLNNGEQVEKVVGFNPKNKIEDIISRVKR